MGLGIEVVVASLDVLGGRKHTFPVVRDSLDESIDLVAVVAVVKLALDL